MKGCQVVWKAKGNTRTGPRVMTTRYRVTQVLYSRYERVSLDPFVPMAEEKRGRGTGKRGRGKEGRCCETENEVIRNRCFRYSNKFELEIGDWGNETTHT